MEAIVVFVGFLGAGKTTLLRRLVPNLLNNGWNPFVIINDYLNANLDAQQFSEFLSLDHIKPISGSCICCSGLAELRCQVNAIAERPRGITLIEANGTTDAPALMEFLAVGIDQRFSPPFQICVVDVRQWQKRGHHNALESNQVRVASLIVLNHTEAVTHDRLEKVKTHIHSLNPAALIRNWQEVQFDDLPHLKPTSQDLGEMDPCRAQWASCSVELPERMPSERVEQILEELPDSILRAKGCTRMDENEGYTFFERTPAGEVFTRPQRGALVSGPRLLVVGPGSDPDLLRGLIERTDQNTVSC